MEKISYRIDPVFNEIIAQVTTDNNVVDEKVFPDLIKQVNQKIERVFADGAYDRRSCYEICYDKNITAIIPPQKKAVLQDERQKQVKRIKCKNARDAIIKRIRTLKETTNDYDEARKKWKIESGYHTRSLVETAMFRFKTIFGDKLLSRNMSNQKTEMLIKTSILNKFTKIGMPDSYPICH